MKILVSACLLGDNVKYDGNNNYNQELVDFLKNYEVIKVCPECLGGLTVPRLPSEILHDKVINEEGTDVTKEFNEGAQKTLELAQREDIKIAILKRNSPSCGEGSIYDGTFTHTVTKGDGITTKLLKENGIIVLNEKNYKEYFKKRGIIKDTNNHIIKELCDLKYKNKPLVIPLGWKDSGDVYYRNFKKVSGLFIAGATGSGKSVFIDDLILSLMYKNTKDDIKFIMLDPKHIELGEYDGISYLLDGKSHSNLKKGYDMLLFLLKVLESRVNTLNKKNYFSIDNYNNDNNEKWPHIFLIIDEVSNIIKIKEAHTVFSKILDYGSRIGIHLIYATNAYLKDYSNSKFIDKFKYRMTFDLASIEQSEYMNIEGSSWLKGSGVALIKSSNGELCKFQAPMVTDEEINDVVANNK